VKDQSDTQKDSMISVIIPLFNEAGNVEPLCAELTPALDSLKRDYAVIFVDDGSTDGTGDALAKAAADNPRFKIVTFKRNAGQTPAMMAGIDHAAGELVPADQRHGVRSLDHHATDVGATHAAGLDSDEDVARTGELGAGDVLDSDVSGAVQNSRGHR